MQEIDEMRLAFWAKQGCRHCNGRGYLLFSLPDGTEEKSPCTCVRVKF